MKFTFTFFVLILCLSASAQKLDALNKSYLLDSLEDRYFYKIKIISETSFSKDTYNFMIGRAYKGFYASGSSKKINPYCSDTTWMDYNRVLLQESQLDSLRQFELKLASLNNEIYNNTGWKFNYYRCWL